MEIVFWKVTPVVIYQIVINVSKENNTVLNAQAHFSQAPQENVFLAVAMSTVWSVMKMEPVVFAIMDIQNIQMKLV